MPPSASPPALELRGIVKRYRSGFLAVRRTVLDGVDLTLAPGESRGLIGPNGSGKSTLLRLATGLERPSAGSVRVFGRPPHDRSTLRRIGYLPDGFPFPPELSSRAVLELLGAFHGLPRRERAPTAERWLERVGLKGESRRALRHFSLGMRRRFGLAQAFLHGPDLLLLDEPTAGLDAEGYLVMEELLAEARARGASVLVATHVPSDLQDSCERCSVLFAGRIVSELATADLLGSRSLLAGLYRTLARGEST
jgi:ABC-2 type transport system ATP-binding protein